MGYTPVMEPTETPADASTRSTAYSERMARARANKSRSRSLVSQISSSQVNSSSAVMLSPVAPLTSPTSPRSPDRGRVPANSPTPAEDNALANLLGAAVDHTIRAPEEVVPAREAVVAATAGPPPHDALDIGFMLDMSDEPRAKKRPARKSAQTSQPTPQPTEEEVDEFEDEMVTLEVGSAAARPEEDDDDEFGGGATAVGFGVVAQPSAPPTNSSAWEGEADAAPPPAVSAPPTNSPAKHAHASPEPTGADAAAAAAAEKVSQLAEAAERDRIALAEAAAAAEQQARAAKQAGAAESLSGLREEMKQALRSVQQVAAASEEGGGGAGAGPEHQQPAIAHAPKSEVEKADETYAASLRKLTPHDAIAEGEEEEEEEEVEVAAGEGAAPTAADGGGSSGEAAAAAAAAAAAGEGAAAAGASAGDVPASAAPTAAEAEAAKAARVEVMRAAREATIMSQFDAATEAADQSRTLTKAEQRKAGRTRIFYAEATVALLGKEADLTEPMQGIVREDWASAPLPQRLLRPCRPRLRTPELRTQRDRLMALARVPMDSSEPHERILMALYCVLTGDSTWPPRYGAHWEVIGFQGNDPATDLRGAGMLALLQVIISPRPRASAPFRWYSLHTMRRVCAPPRLIPPTLMRRRYTSRASSRS